MYPNFGSNQSIINNCFRIQSDYGFNYRGPNWYPMPSLYFPQVLMPSLKAPESMNISMLQFKPPVFNPLKPMSFGTFNMSTANVGNMTIPPLSLGTMSDTFCTSLKQSNGSNTKKALNLTNPQSNRQNKINPSVKYDEYIVKYSNQFGVDANLVRALMKQESGFNAKALSSANCKGLMQLSEPTAKEMGVTDIYNPEQNIMGGVKYLKKMLDRYNGNVELALAAYNAGPGRVKDSVPNIPETQKHVKAVMKNYKEYQNA